MENITPRQVIKKLRDVFEIVYIDDEDYNTYMFQDEFEQDFNIKTFNDAKEALCYILESKAVGVIFCDQSMPDIKGLELECRVRSLKPYIKFIMISGNPEHEEDLLYKSIKHHHFYDFLSKPIDFNKGKKDIEQLIASCFELFFAEYSEHNYSEATNQICQYPATPEDLINTQSFCQSELKSHYHQFKFSLEVTSIAISLISQNNNFEILQLERIAKDLWRLNIKDNSGWQNTEYLGPLSQLISLFVSEFSLILNQLPSDLFDQSLQATLNKL